VRPVERSASIRIAVVEDEDHIRDTVADALEREGYGVARFRDGAEAWDAFQEGLPELAILDIMMPRMDGLELCRRIRGLSDEVSIFFLTSRDEEFDRVLGLELGADDYLCKPFSMRELVARVKVLFRRMSLRGDPGLAPADALHAGSLTLDLARYEARWLEQAVPLTVTEFRLLLALARHPGHVKTRAQLLEQAYPDDTFVADRTIDSHVKRLRRKFESLDGAFAQIETVYGLGYRYRERGAAGEGEGPDGGSGSS
jgi:two-component system response regulator ChvI